MRPAASAALLLLAAALAAAAAGCGTAPRRLPDAGVPGTVAPGGGAPGGPPVGAPVPLVSEAPPPAADREDLLRRVGALLDGSGAAGSGHAAALAELDRYLAARPAERGEVSLQLLGRLLREHVQLAGSVAEARKRSDALAREKAALAAELEKANRERDELKALVQRLKELEMQMEEKRKRLR